MLIELTDFPSDPNGETGKLREEILKALQNVETYPGRAPRVRSILNFATKKLAELTKPQPKQKLVTNKKTKE